MAGLVRSHDDNASQPVGKFERPRLGKIRRPLTLAELGTSVVPARSAEEALERMASEDFAIVVLDVRTPGLSGLELARRARPQHRAAQTPHHLGHGRREDPSALRDAYALGAVD